MDNKDVDMKEIEAKAKKLKEEIDKITSTIVNLENVKGHPVAKVNNVVYCSFRNVRRFM